MLVQIHDKISLFALGAFLSVIPAVVPGCVPWRSSPANIAIKYSRSRWNITLKYKYITFYSIQYITCTLQYNTWHFNTIQYTLHYNNHITYRNIHTYIYITWSLKHILGIIRVQPREKNKHRIKPAGKPTIKTLWWLDIFLLSFLRTWLFTCIIKQVPQSICISHLQGDECAWLSCNSLFG